MATLYDLIEDLTRLDAALERRPNLTAGQVRQLIAKLIDKYDQAPADPAVPRVRRAAPDTSRQGAQDVAPRVGPQAARLLQAFKDTDLTNYEAGDAAGLLGSAYWMRCGDLSRQGMIEPVTDDEGRPLTRRNPASGSAQQVRRITAKGRAWLRHNGQESA